MLALHFLAAAKSTASNTNGRTAVSQHEQISRLLAFNNVAALLIFVIAMIALISVSQ